MRSRSSLLIAALLWLLCAKSRAALPSVAWDAPPACPDAAAVRDLLQRVADPARPDGIRAVRAVIRAQAGEYTLDLELQTASGSHRSELRAQLCSTFVELLALELSLAAAPREAAARAAPAARLAWGARLSAAVGSGPTPAPAPGIALALAVVRRRMRLELAGSYAFPRTVHYAETPQVGARLDAIGGEARGCYLLALRRVEFPLCGGAELAALRASGDGVAQAKDASELWAALFVAPALRLPIVGPLSAWLELAGWVALRRPSFGVQNLPALYRPDALGVRGAAGLALQFD